MGVSGPHFNDNRDGTIVGRAMEKCSLCVIASYFGCDMACGVCNVAIPGSPSSRCTSLGEIVSTTSSGTGEVSIVVPVLCRNERRGESDHRSLSYTVTLRRLMGLNIRGVVAFSTRSREIRGTVPRGSFRGIVPACRVVGTVMGGVSSLGISGSRLVIVSPSRNTVREYVCFTARLNIGLNVFCGEESFAGIISNEGPVIRRRCLNSPVGNGSVVVISSVVSSNRSVLRITGGLGKLNTGEVFIYAAFNLFTGKLSIFSRTCGRNIFRGIFAAGNICRAPRLLSER